MSTLAQMRSNIADELNRSDINTQIDRAINRAIEYYYKKEVFWFNDTSASFSTIATQESYSSTDTSITDIKSINRLELVLSSTNYQPLFEKSFDWIRDYNQSRATGDPIYWAWYNEKIYFNLIPNAVKTINVFYKKIYVTLSTDGSSNDYTNYAEDLIESRAKWVLYKRLLKNFAAAKECKEEEEDALSALRDATNDKISTNAAEPTIF